MLTLWNVYSFFIGYAEIDKFDPSQKPADWKPENEIDRWVLSELNTLVSQVDGYMDGYEPTSAGRRISTSCPTGTCAAADAVSGGTKATPTSCPATSPCTPAW